MDVDLTIEDLASAAETRAAALVGTARTDSPAAEDPTAEVDRMEAAVRTVEDTGKFVG
jgi:hypothetical protein